MTAISAWDVGIVQQWKVAEVRVKTLLLDRTSWYPSCSQKMQLHPSSCFRVEGQEKDEGVAHVLRWWSDHDLIWLYVLTYSHSTLKKFWISFVAPFSMFKSATAFPTGRREFVTLPRACLINQTRLACRASGPVEEKQSSSNSQEKPLANPQRLRVRLEE